MFFSNLLATSSRGRGSSRSKSQSQTTDSSLSPLLPPTLIPSPTSTPKAQLQLQSRAADSSSRSDYIFDESQLQPVTQPPNDVLDLNKDLESLSTLFPDVQVEVFREMLSSFSDESKLFVITDMLLKNPAVYVKGRRRSVHQEARQRIPKPEAFRAPAYKTAVRALALQEFKGLSRSAIEAVLSENNYSYLDARPTLVEISSKSWRFTISALLFRRKPVTSSEAEAHPLVIWRTENSALSPAVKTTGNAELDRELFEELILPLKSREKASREKADRALALSAQTEEAEACKATYECACCYTDSIFEEITTCSAEGHMVCFRCIQQSITEAVFGQGWQRSIHKDTGTLRCPAVSANDCEGCVSAEHIRRAMDETEKGAEILEKLDERLAEHNLISSGLQLIRCPFCSYVEVDDLYMPPEDTNPLRIRLSKIPNVLFILIAIILSPVSPALIVLGIIFLALSFKSSFRLFISQQFAGALNRYQRRRRGLRFVCQNPRCQRPSCLSCSKAWVDIHVCHESSLIALRTQVEQAMSMAIKRVCPRCNTSFVKTAGCNKLTCPCGYKMCYVCRKDIGDPNEGYQHFCQHFRPEGDGRQCTECNKCNLWETENTDVILRKAKADAERRWRETERRELSGAEKAYLEDGVGNVSIASAAYGGGVMSSVLPGGRLPSLQEICDFLFETFVV